MDNQPLDFSPKKRFGQNFMTQESDLGFIADALGLEKGQPVLEIGPGLGALTRVLLEKGFQVYAVEKDRALIDFLKKEFQGKPLQIFSGDILQFDPKKEISGPFPMAVVGNIPYNITSPILFWLVERRDLFSHVVLTMQKEVAERITGRPGSKIWGALSVSVQAYANVSFLKLISKANFKPVPKVDSAVIRLNFLPKPCYAEGIGEFFHLIVAKAFQKRRKTLLNALENPEKGLSKELLKKAFLETGLEVSQRPETLEVKQWAALALCLSRSR